MAKIKIDMLNKGQVLYNKKIDRFVRITELNEDKSEDWVMKVEWIMDPHQHVDEYKVKKNVINDYSSLTGMIDIGTDLTGFIDSMIYITTTWATFNVFCTGVLMKDIKVNGKKKRLQYGIRVEDGQSYELKNIIEISQTRLK